MDLDTLEGHTITDPDELEGIAARLEAEAPAPPAKRKPGRPPKAKPAGEAQAAIEAPLDAPMPPRSKDTREAVKSAPSPSQAWKLDGELIGFGVAAVFGVIATVTTHQHWLRTPAQCAPIAEPLQRMYSKLPAAKRKQITQMLDPGILLAGIYQVAGPSIEEELRLAQMRQQGQVSSGRPPVLPPQPGNPPAAPPASSGAPEDPGKISSLQGHFGGIN